MDDFLRMGYCGSWYNYQYFQSFIDPVDNIDLMSPCPGRSRGSEQAVSGT